MLTKPKGSASPPPTSGGAGTMCTALIEPDARRGQAQRGRARSGRFAPRQLAPRLAVRKRRDERARERLALVEQAHRQLVAGTQAVRVLLGATAPA